MVKPIHGVMKIQNFVIDNFIDLDETNEKDVFEIDETQFDKELVYKSKNTTNQFQLSNSKSVKSITSISFTEINIDIINIPAYNVSVLETNLSDEKFQILIQEGYSTVDFYLHG